MSIAFHTTSEKFLSKYHLLTRCKILPAQLLKTVTIMMSWVTCWCLNLKYFFVIGGKDSKWRMRPLTLLLHLSVLRSQPEPQTCICLTSVLYIKSKIHRKKRNYVQCMKYSIQNGNCKLWHEMGFVQNKFVRLIRKGWRGFKLYSKNTN